jgi:RNA polymerase sigma-70 factor (ECF subfamily)
VLLWLEELPYEQIAEVLGLSVGAVSVRLVRAREKLRRLVGAPAPRRTGER